MSGLLPSWYEIELLRLTNEVRAAGGYVEKQHLPPAPPLAWDLRVYQAAREHCHAMLDEGFFDHVGTDGWGPQARLERAGYVWSISGENIASGQPNPEAVLKSWLESPGHCRNMLDRRYIHGAIAYTLGGPNGHLWVQVLAAPL